MQFGSIPPFDVLTAAEASVFEKALAERRFSAGARFRTDGALLILREGAVDLAVDSERGALPFTTLGSGDFVGEVDLFEPEPVKLFVDARTDSSCYSVDRQSLLHAFRYSRTGAVKCMGIFARSLSRKIRAANRLLEKGDSTRPASGDLAPARLASRDLERLKALAVPRSVESGVEIFKEGDASHELFIISEGEVEIVKAGGSGEPLSLARLGPGDFLGEMAFVDQVARSATAVARTAVELHVVPAGALERLPELHLGTAIYLSSVICKIMARRLNAALKRAASL